MPPLPRLGNEEQYADWLELSALEAPDGNASTGDLLSALARVDDRFDPDSVSMDAMNEIEQREIASGRAYPFVINDSRVIQTKEAWSDHPAYVFCLCLSYFGWHQVADAPINPWKLFEDLACLAAEQYVQGRAIKFGSRGGGEHAAFIEAINNLCLSLGEGNGFRDQPTINRQDDKVDIVAWREFADRRRSKLIMFGQCAAGSNWASKITELQPEAFWNQWMIESNVSPLLRSFYIPHRIPKDRWDYYGRQAGILFDRCRVAFWSDRANDAVVADSRFLQWCRETDSLLR